MQLDNLFDPTSALIVVGGTALATVLRCGFHDTRAAVSALLRLTSGRFQPEHARAELAVQIQEIRQDGVLRSQPHHFGDAELDDATDALIGTRSLAGVEAAHHAHKQHRAEQNAAALHVFSQAADMSPVLGLAGTLISLSQLPTATGAGGSFTGAISMAVLTTLYGLVLGNLVLAPVGRMVERRAAQEERDRQGVLDWLRGQVAEVLPRGATCP